MNYDELATVRKQALMLANGETLLTASVKNKKLLLKHLEDCKRNTSAAIKQVKEIIKEEVIQGDK